MKKKRTNYRMRRLLRCAYGMGENFRSQKDFNEWLDLVAPCKTQANQGEEQ